ncbi:GroES-like superfamily [Sesbania bispinosa]|nr:GroES-like superfamily [Sesbania bispinosa]
MAGPEVANGNGSLNLKPSDTKGKTITCKAAVAYGPGQPFMVEQILVHPPQKLENESQRVYPRIFGHEASGVVESVGEGVSDMEEGDIVVPIFNGECGECSYCKCEKTNMCERFGVNPMKKVMYGDGKSRFSTMDGKPIFHFLNTSTFTEYTVLDSACVVKFHPQHNLSLKNLTLLSCGVSTGKFVCLI